MVRKLFLTPPDLPSENQCRSLEIPSSQAWLGIFNQALLQLANQYNYEQVNDTDLTPEAVAATCYAIYEQYLLSTCGTGDVLAPYWDDADGADADDDLPPAEQPWYETLSDWAVTAFLATGIGPTAAVQFVTLARQFRLAFRTRSYGGILRVLLDNVEIGQVDTYSAADGLTTLDVISPGTTLRIEATGTANPSAVPYSGTDYAIEIIRKRLWEGEIVPENVRYNEETDEVERTWDGGTTWVPDPQADPRYSDAYRAPPLEGASAQCDAAANMVARIQAYVDMIVSATDTVNLANGILFILLPLLPISVLWALILAIADILIAIGGTVIDNAFTQAVYDQLLCIFFNNIDPDGQISAAQLADIDAQISSDIGGVAYTVVNSLFQQLGEVGMSNAGALGEETGDCDECAESWYYRLDFTVQKWGFDNYSHYDDWQRFPLPPTIMGTWVLGEGFRQGTDASGWYAVNIRGAVPEWLLAGNITQFSVGISWSEAGGYGHGDGAAKPAHSGTSSPPTWTTGAMPNNNGTGLMAWPVDATQIDWGAAAGGPFNAYIAFIDFWGYGVPPVPPP